MMRGAAHPTVAQLPIALAVAKNKFISFKFVFFVVNGILFKYDDFHQMVSVKRRYHDGFFLC